MRTLLVIILVVCLVHEGLACGKKKKKKAQEQQQQQQQQQPAQPSGPAECDSVQCVVGDGVTADEYHPAGDEPGDCSQLECKDGDNCHWSNAEPPADNLAWVKSGGSPDDAKWSKAFGTSAKPDGDSLHTYSRNTGTSDQTAELYSAPIQCAGEKIHVKLKHWATSGTKIQVCTVDSPEGTPKNCKDMSGNGKEDEVEVPGGENVRVVIQAKGFKNSKDVAFIDDISVECEPCTTTPAPTDAPTAAPTTAAPVALPPCKEIECNFENGPCQYQAAEGEGFGVHEAPWQNRLTGVRTHSPEGTKFAAGYFKLSGKKIVFKTNANFDSAYTVKYMFYEATEGLEVKGCCDGTENCPHKEDPNVKVSDYKVWREASFSCPAGTKQVYFTCEDTKKKSEGACAIDNVRLYQADGNQGACSNGNGNGGG